MAFGTRIYRMKTKHRGGILAGVAVLLVLYGKQRTESWQSIWQRKGAPRLVPATVDDLIAIDGFDHSKRMKSVLQEYASQVTLGRDDVLCDIGCGSGAFLHILPRPILALCVDLSANLLRASRRYIKTYAPDMRVLHLQGDMTDLNQIPPGFCDVTVVQSVFQYLPDLKAARVAVTELQRITKGRIYVFDVRDGQTAEYTRVRQKAGITRSNPHLFIPRTFWSGGWTISEPSALMRRAYYNAPFAYHVHT